MSSEAWDGVAGGLVAVAVAVLGRAQQRRGGVPFGARAVWERSSPPRSVCLPAVRVRAAGLYARSFLPRAGNTTPVQCPSRGLNWRLTRPSVTVRFVDSRKVVM